MINQTLNEIEIICIDDASIDCSFDILSKYSCKDPRIIIFQNDRNLGVSYSRNLGLRETTGKYIYYLDPDDMIILNALESLYNLAEEKKVEGVLFRLI